MIGSHGRTTHGAPERPVVKGAVGRCPDMCVFVCVRAHARRFLRWYQW